MRPAWDESDRSHALWLLAAMRDCFPKPAVAGWGPRLEQLAERVRELPPSEAHELLRSMDRSLFGTMGSLSDSAGPELDAMLTQLHVLIFGRRG